MSFKTRIAGLRYNVMLAFLPFASPMADEFARTHQTIPASVLLGAILIWFSYRRWSKVEAG